MNFAYFQSKKLNYSEDEKLAKKAKKNFEPWEDLELREWFATILNPAGFAQWSFEPALKRKINRLVLSSGKSRSWSKI